MMAETRFLRSAMQGGLRNIKLLLLITGPQALFGRFDALTSLQLSPYSTGMRPSNCAL